MPPHHFRQGGPHEARFKAFATAVIEHKEPPRIPWAVRKITGEIHVGEVNSQHPSFIHNGQGPPPEGKMPLHDVEAAGFLRRAAVLPNEIIIAHSLNSGTFQQIPKASDGTAELVESEAKKHFSGKKVTITRV